MTMMETTPACLRGLLRAAMAGGPDAVGILADALDDCGLDGCAAHLRQQTSSYWIRSAARGAYYQCLNRGILRWQDEPLWRKAVRFHEAMDRVDLEAVPVLAPEWNIPVKAQAALLRDQLKRLEVPHVSVRVMRGANVFAVSVTLPCRSDPVAEAARANLAADDKFKRLVALVFPNHDDRSGPMTDYYDARWFFDTRREP
jgi:hypothetical protein